MNILLVEDHVITSLGMVMIIQKTVPGSKVHSAHNFDDAIKIATNHPVDLIILDLSLPGSLGTDMIKSFRDIHPDVKILIFSGRDEYLNALTYINHGANGFLHKGSPTDQTENAILTVLKGKQYMSADLVKRMYVDYINDDGVMNNPIESLSPREKEVFDLMMDGTVTKDIATKLNIKYSTVSTQKLRIFQKFQVDNIVDLVKKVEEITDNLKPKTK